MKWLRFDLYLAGHFSTLGACVARSPGVFILVPLLLTLLMGSGLQQFNYMSDVFYLFVPVHAESIQVLLCLARKGVYAPDGPAFLANTKQKVIHIVGLSALRLAFFMG